MKKKAEMSAESAKMFVSAQSVKTSDIPQPDSSSGMSFDELYRLREVVSFFGSGFALCDVMHTRVCMMCLICLYQDARALGFFSMANLGISLNGWMP